MDIFLDASRLGIYPPVFTSPSGDSCILFKKPCIVVSNICVFNYLTLSIIQTSNNNYYWVFKSQQINVMEFQLNEYFDTVHYFIYRQRDQLCLKWQRWFQWWQMTLRAVSWKESRWVPSGITNSAVLVLLVLHSLFSCSWCLFTVVLNCVHRWEEKISKDMEISAHSLAFEHEAQSC